MTKFFQIDKSKDATIDGANMFLQNKIATRYAFLDWRVVVIVVRGANKKIPHFVKVGTAEKTWFKLGKI